MRATRGWRWAARRSGAGRVEWAGLALAALRGFGYFGYAPPRGCSITAVPSLWAWAPADRAIPRDTGRRSLAPSDPRRFRVSNDIPQTEQSAAADAIPVLPLREVVVYPQLVIPLFVGREKSILALDQAMRSGKQILLVAQKQADVDDPGAQDLYRLGTIATILQLLKLPDGTVKVLVEGAERARIEKLITGQYFSAEISSYQDVEQY